MMRTFMLLLVAVLMTPMLGVSSAHAQTYDCSTIVLYGNGLGTRSNVYSFDAEIGATVQLISSNTQPYGRIVNSSSSNFLATLTNYVTIYSFTSAMQAEVFFHSSYNLVTDTASFRICHIALEPTPEPTSAPEPTPIVAPTIAPIVAPRDPVNCDEASVELQRDAFAVGAPVTHDAYAQPSYWRWVEGGVLRLEADSTTHRIGPGHWSRVDLAANTSAVIDAEGSETMAVWCGLLPVAPTPTAIGVVDLELSGIITTTQVIMTNQVAAWEPDAPTGPLFLGLTMVVFVFGMALIIKSSLTP